VKKATKLHCVPKKPDTRIMVNNFHKHRAISMSFDRIVRATEVDNLLYCAKLHLISFLPTSGHLIAPTYPVDYRIWGCLQDPKNVYQKRICDINELKQHLV